MRVCFDSSVLVASVRPAEAEHVSSRRLLEQVAAGVITLHCPGTVMVEVVAALRRRSGIEEAREAHKDLRSAMWITWVAPSREFLDHAAAIALRTAVRGGDAIVVAHAETHGLPLVTLDDEVKERGGLVAETYYPREFEKKLNEG